MQNNEHQALESRAAGKTAKRIQSVSMATASLLFSAASAFGSDDAKWNSFRIRRSKVSSCTTGAKPGGLQSTAYRPA